MARQHNNTDNKRDSFLHKWLSGGGTVASSDGGDKNDRLRPSWMETFLGRSSTANNEEKDKLVQTLTSQVRQVAPEDLPTTKFSLTAHELMLLLDLPETASVLPEEEAPHYCIHTRDCSNVSAWDFKSEDSLPPDEIEAIVLALEADAEAEDDDDDDDEAGEATSAISAITGSSTGKTIAKTAETDATKLPIVARNISIQRFKSVDTKEDQFLVTIGDDIDVPAATNTALEQIQERSQKAEARLQRRYSLTVKNSQDDEAQKPTQEQDKPSELRQSTKLQASVKMLSRTKSDVSVHQFIVSLPTTNTNALTNSIGSGSVPEKELHLPARRVSVQPMHFDASSSQTSSMMGMLMMPAMKVFDLEDRSAKAETHNNFRPTMVRMNGSTKLHEFGVAGLG